MSKYLKLLNLISGLFTCLILVSCGSDDEIRRPPSTSEPNMFTVDINDQFQTIAGFGGANRMWSPQNYLTGTTAQKAFGLGDGELGLSIFRERIPPNSTDWSDLVPSLSAAQNNGVKILASPWSPPANLKSNTNLVGGYLLSENYAAYKDHLNSYISFMASNGVTIDAISIQNEPDIEVSYESCDWTANQMTDFLSQFGDQINARLVAPESFNFNQGFTNTILSNSSALQNLDIVGGHIYGGGLGYFPLAEQNNKEIWMTEYLLNLNTGNTGAPSWPSYSDNEIWEESLTMLETIHQAMSYNWNAYIWWYTQRYYSFIGDGTEGTVAGEILKRGYAFSHFSRFVRPGFVRVGISDDDNTGLKVTAYDGNTKIVIVIINESSSTVSDVQFQVPEVSAASAVETTALTTMEDKNVTIEDGNKVELLSIAAKSITTIEIEK